MYMCAKTKMATQRVLRCVYSLAVVAHAFNPSTRKAEAGGFLLVRGQPGLQSEFQDSRGYTEKPCLGKKENIFIC